METRSSDIDVVCISQIERALFFNELSAALRSWPRVQGVKVVEDAVAPVASFLLFGTQIDVTYAAIPSFIPLAISDRTDFLHLSPDLQQKLMKFLDEKTLKALNGILDIETLLASVPNFFKFKTILRFVKCWAKSLSMN